MGCCLTGCEKNWTDTIIDSEKALIVTPAGTTKADGGKQMKDVQIKSYKLASYNENEGHQNPDADIHIVITSKAGDIITIRFAHGVTPHDGYY